MAFFSDIFRDPFISRDPFDDLITRRLEATFSPFDFNNPPTLLIGDAGAERTQSQSQPNQQQVTTTDRPSTWQALMRAPRLDFSEQDNTYVVKVDLPGVDKDKVDIHVENGNILAISGKREEEKEEKGERFYRKERSYGSFERRVRMPEDAQVENAQATVEQGVLTVKFSKGQKPDDRKKINIE
ncbi:hypothetical protein HK097_008861 [Rhizophlyctis rosea]|uniref:SHSP domain-containing protein n=1 Tax=Rhizophlyctis rosea TaxID=64517 RepID=A0AAD5X4A0_9FUNG|nr:hypothetical protein HK097_008861 [Rhizophlyctis rosea]